MNTPLRAYREAAGLTQAQLAKLLGISQPMVAAIENGKRTITAEKAVEWDLATNGKLAREQLRPDLFAAKPRRKIATQ